MNKLAKTAIISFLSVSSFGLSVAPQANALTSNLRSLESPTISRPSQSQLNSLKLVQEQKLAYTVYCETHTDGYTTVSCCADSYGNWECEAVY